MELEVQSGHDRERRKREGRELTATLLERRWAPAENLEKIPTIVSSAPALARSFLSELNEAVRFSCPQGALIDALAVIDLSEWFY
jgi:hypothetical protein